MPRRPAQYRLVGLPAGTAGAATDFVLVAALNKKERHDRSTLIVDLRFQSRMRTLRVRAVQLQPRSIVAIQCCITPITVRRYEMQSIPFEDTLDHRLSDFESARRRVRIGITSRDPHNIWKRRIPRAEPAAVLTHLLCSIRHHLSTISLIAALVSEISRGQEDDHALRLRLLYHPIGMREVRFVGRRKVAANQER